MPKVRVMHVLEATLGGTRRYLEDMIFSGALDNFDCCLVYSTMRSDSQFSSLLQELNTRNWSLFNVAIKREVDIFSDIHNILVIRKLISKFRPDIIHCHSSKGGALGRIAAMLIHSKKRPKTVYTPNALAIHLGRQYIIIEKMLTKFTSLFVSISDSEAAEIVKYTGVSSEKVFTVWPSIDCEYFSPINQAAARSMLGIDQKAKLIIGIGRITEQKAPLLFLELFKRLKTGHKNLFAIWVGDGNLRTEMEEYQEKMEINNFLVTGWVNDVRPYIGAADIVIVPSQYESFGYVTAESLAMQRPVAATRVNGSIDLIEEDVNGILFEPGNTSEGFQKIDLMLSETEKVVNMGKIGREQIIKKYSTINMCLNLRKAYEKAASLME